MSPRSLWLLSGKDPSGGAGIDRDRATAREVAPELSVCAAVTVWTRQGDGERARVDRVDPGRLRSEIDAFPAPAAVKVGLVAEPVLPVVCAAIADLGAPVVVDPVLRASDGGLIGPPPAALRPLLELATLVTPNRAEAAQLDLIGLPAAVLYKAGREERARIVDILVVGQDVLELEHARTPGDPRGTGCALSTAIACYLAGGLALRDAVAQGVDWVASVYRSRPLEPHGG